MEEEDKKRIPKGAARTRKGFRRGAGLEGTTQAQIRFNQRLGSLNAVRLILSSSIVSLVLLLFFLSPLTNMPAFRFWSN